MPVLANIEAIWVVIIIVSVIAQIVKAARKAAAQAQERARPASSPGEASERPAQAGGQRPSAEQRDAVSPEVALQEFLRNLTGETPPQPPRPAPAAPPVRPAPSPAVRAGTARVPPVSSRQQSSPSRTDRRAEQARSRRSVPPPVARPVVVQPVFTPESVAPDDDSVSITRFPEPVSASAGTGLRHDIRRKLRDRQFARSAIVMREILGPPLALR